MRQVSGIWIPDSEIGLVDPLEKSPLFFKKGTYQVDKFLACLPYIRKFEFAIDVGAHVGLWSHVLQRTFRRTVAFEPIPLLRDCLNANCPGLEIEPYALGEKTDMLTMRVDLGTTGNSHMKTGGDLHVSVRPLDNFNYQHIDFIKIDVEGFEEPVLRGAERLIKNYHPCILVEQKQGMAERHGLRPMGAVRLLQSWGMCVNWDMSGDFCLNWGG